MISGFRKSGIYPLDRQQVLNRLPSQSLDSSISSIIGDCFLDQIRRKREETTKGHNQTKRRRKLNVPPGKSISSEELEAVASYEPQPSTSGGVQAIPPAQGRMRQRRERRWSNSSSSDDGSCNISFQDSDDSMTLELGDDEDEPNLSMSSQQGEFSVQDLTVGQYVLVNYEGELYPGKIIEIKSSDEILVSAMEKSGVNWKWPAQCDEIYYAKDEIVQIINSPKQLGRRGIYRVHELDVYNN